jgi:hypothetical protein
LKIGQIGLVQRDNMVKAVKIRTFNLSRAQAGDIHAMLCRLGTGARVGRFANVPTARSGRIDIDLHAHTTGGRTKCPLGQRRAANIAQTDKKD